MLPKTNTQKAHLLKPFISQPEEDSVSSRQPVREQGLLLVWDWTKSVFYDSCDLPAEAILECVHITKDTGPEAGGRDYITPFTRTTYSHLNPHLNPHPNSVPFTRPSRKSSLVMQAALFHVTRVRDASAMVFAKLLQLLLLYFWLRARRRRRIRAKRRRLSSWDHAFTASASLRWRSQRGLPPRCALAY